MFSFLHQTFVSLVLYNEATNQLWLHIGDHDENEIIIYLLHHLDHPLDLLLHHEVILIYLG